MTITEQDRATARRVIRRHAGVGANVHVHTVMRQCPIKVSPGYLNVSTWRTVAPSVFVAWDVYQAASSAAALGRAYGKALRGAK